MKFTIVLVVVIVSLFANEADSYYSRRRFGFFTRTVAYTIRSLNDVQVPQQNNTITIRRIRGGSLLGGLIRAARRDAAFRFSGSYTTGFQVNQLTNVTIAEPFEWILTRNGNAIETGIDRIFPRRRDVFTFTLTASP